MITLRVLSPLVTKIEGTDIPLKSLREALSFPVQGAQFHRAHVLWKRTNGKSGWDGRKHLFDKTTFSFPTGLIPRVKEVLTKLKRPFEEYWHFKTPYEGIKNKSLPKHVKGRDYQLEAATIALKKNRGVIKLPTGSGKSLTGLAIAYQADLPTLVLVHRVNLVTQWRDDAVKHLKCKPDDVRVLVRGKWEGSPKAKIQVMNLGSILSALKKTNPAKREAMLKFLTKFKVLILDECHHAPAASFHEVVGSIPAPIRIGLSATPFDQADDTGLVLEGDIGQVIFTAEAKELVKDKHLAQGMLFMQKCTKPEDLDAKRITYPEAYRAGIVYNRHRNNLIVRRACEQAALGKRVLILVKEIVHGYNLLDTFERLAKKEIVPSLDVAYATASLAPKHIKEMLTDFDQGKIDVMVASPVFGEGTDIPSVDVVVIADAGKSVINLMQKVGRATRTNQGKKSHYLVIDIEDDTQDYLRKHAAQRVKTYKKAGLIFVTDALKAWKLSKKTR